MKRLVFCFDGTWNRLSADTPTNVVLLAASISRVTRKGVTQIMHYDEGVGTGRLEKYSGGLFGQGLVENIREAYRFLIFNYDPGDELYVFGFSRGAYSARTFIGLVRHAGILRRKHVARIDEALDRYRARLAGQDRDGEKMCKFRADYANAACIGEADLNWRRTHPADSQDTAHQLRFRYVGVWDTVGALGVPQALPFAGWLNRKHRFHDVSLSDFIEFGRHAVALDERRVLFPVTLWENIDGLNKARGSAADDRKAPYQERWFPGTHGGVGGGGDIRGLSDGALAWIVKGAKEAGLELDVSPSSRTNGIDPDFRAAVDNMSKPKASLMNKWTTNRSGPQRLWQVSPSARRRWRESADKLPEGTAYRPGALAAVASAMDAEAAENPDHIEGDAPLLELHTVVSGDSLGRLALHYYGKASLYDLIFSANRDILDDPDEIFVGDIIRIPTLPPTV
jgi:uncharacterized protein (DUF2235 family)